MCGRDDGRGDDDDGEDGAEGEDVDARDDDYADDDDADEASMGTALTVTICPRALFCQLRLGVRDIKHNATLLLIKDCADCSACLVHAMPVKPNMHWFSSDHHAMLSLGIRPQHG